MEKRCYTHVLRIDEDGELLFGQSTEEPRPGVPFEIHDSKVLLAGGFSSVSPDSSLPLSSALQLNADLTTLSPEKLQNIAESELLRIQSADFHSYQVDADLRVCVIADKASLLDDFLDCYGGILEVEPLLTKEDSSVYPKAVDLSIDKKGGEYQIHYRKQAPIDFDRCSYCGLCGRACPEKCITPDLYVDKSVCSYCKECENVCPSQAVDIHGAIETVVQVPAIIVLGDASLELPEDRKTVFSGSRMSEYFKTLYSCEIKEVVCHNNSICQYSGRLDKGCGRCIDSCNYGALSRKESGIVVDHMLCEECGNCISVCPTGAMQNGYFKDEVFLRHIKSLQTCGAVNLVIGDGSDLHSLWWYAQKDKYESTLFIEYPNIGSLSYYHLLAMFVAGFKQVVVLSSKDKSAGSQLAGEVAKANIITQDLLSMECSRLCDSRELAEVQLNSTPHPLQTIDADFSHRNRRHGLSQMLQMIIAASAGEVNVTDGGFDFTDIVCDNRGCTHCLACLNECKTLALQTDENNLVLDYDPGLCVGCGVCVGVCPEKVLTMEKVAVLNGDYFEKRLLAQSEPATCKGCGKVFGSRKSLDRVLNILSAKESVNADHFEYCGDCRVINIFKAEEV